MTLKLKVTALTLATYTVMTLLAAAQTTPAAPAPDAKTSESQTNAAAPATGTEVKKPAKQLQADVASKTATFGKVAKTDDAYKTAVEAHAIDDALKLVDKDGAFKGTVAKVFEPRGLAIVEFDQNYKTALTALVKGNNFTNFPALTNLIGKEVLVTGKFIKYRESAEIVLDKPEQVKVVE